MAAQQQTEAGTHNSAIGLYCCSPELIMKEPTGGVFPKLKCKASVYVQFVTSGAGNLPHPATGFKHWNDSPWGFCRNSLCVCSCCVKKYCLTTPERWTSYMPMPRPADMWQPQAMNLTKASKGKGRIVWLLFSFNMKWESAWFWHKIKQGGAKTQSGSIPKLI